MKLDSFIKRRVGALPSGFLEGITRTCAHLERHLASADTDRSAVVFLGPSGAGKSTLVNFLSGTDYTLGGRRGRRLRPLGPEAVTVGHGTTSQTELPEPVPGPNETMLWDMPGSHDTRGLLAEVGAHLGTAAVLRQINHLSGMVVVLEATDWQGRMLAVRRELAHAGSLVEPSADLPWFLVVTKAPDDWDEDCVIAELARCFEDECKGCDLGSIRPATLIASGMPSARAHLLGMLQYFLIHRERIFLINPCRASDREAVLEAFAGRHSAPRVNLEAFASYLPVLGGIESSWLDYQSHHQALIDELGRHGSTLTRQRQDLRIREQAIRHQQERILTQQGELQSKLEKLRALQQLVEQDLQHSKHALHQTCQAIENNHAEREKTQRHICELASCDRQEFVHAARLSIPRQREHPEARASLMAKRDGKPHADVPLYCPIEVPIVLTLEYPISQFTLEADAVLSRHMHFEGGLSDDRRTLRGVYRSYPRACQSYWYEGRRKKITINLWAYRSDRPCNRGRLQGLKLHLGHLETELEHLAQSRDHCLDAQSKSLQKSLDLSSEIKAIERFIDNQLTPKLGKTHQSIEALLKQHEALQPSLNACLQQKATLSHKLKKTHDSIQGFLACMRYVHPTKCHLHPLPKQDPTP